MFKGQTVWKGNQTIKHLNLFLFRCVENFISGLD